MVVSGLINHSPVGIVGFLLMRLCRVCTGVVVLLGLGHRLVDNIVVSLTYYDGARRRRTLYIRLSCS